MCVQVFYVTLLPPFWILPIPKLTQLKLARCGIEQPLVCHHLVSMLINVDAFSISLNGRLNFFFKRLLRFYAFRLLCYVHVIRCIEMHA